MKWRTPERSSFTLRPKSVVESQRLVRTNIERTLSEQMLEYTAVAYKAYLFRAEIKTYYFKTNKQKKCKKERKKCILWP